MRAKMMTKKMNTEGWMEGNYLPTLCSQRTMCQDIAQLLKVIS